jgi:L,D-transpeptidase YcbB
MYINYSNIRFCNNGLFNCIQRTYTLGILALIVVLWSCIGCDTKPAPRTQQPENVRVTVGDLSARIRNMVGKQKGDATVELYGSTIHDFLIYIYRSNGGKPIWYSPDDTNFVAAKHFLKELEDVRWDGLDPDKYRLNEIQNILNKLTVKHDSLNLAFRFDTLLTSGFLSAARDLLIGIIVPEKADITWFHPNDSSWSAPQMLLAAGSRPVSLDSFRSRFRPYFVLRDAMKYYTKIATDNSIDSDIEQIDSFITKSDSIQIDTAVTLHCFNIIKAELPWMFVVDNAESTHSDTANKGALPDDSFQETDKLKSKNTLLGYQYYFGLPPTGILDKKTLRQLGVPVDTLMERISINLERCRWMERNFGDLFIYVDIPAMELYLNRHDTTAVYMHTVVGKPARPTPSIAAMMNYIEINPTWGVPPTILKQDVLPGIQSSGNRYMQKTGLKAYNFKGKPVNIALINARNYKRFVFRQEAGDKNSLGYVKFNLKNPFDIYLHDTPHRGDFMKYNRALSSGCIRLQRPKELAIYIFSEIEHEKFDSVKLKDKILTHKTEYDILKTKIPVHIAYLTAFQDTTGSHLRFLPDIYKHDSVLHRMMP